MISLEPKFPTGRFLINLRLRSSPYPHPISMIGDHDAPDVYTGKARKESAQSQLRYALFTYNIYKSDSDLWFVIHETCVVVSHFYCAVVYE